MLRVTDERLAFGAVCDAHPQIRTIFVNTRVSRANLDDVALERFRLLVAPAFGRHVGGSADSIADRERQVGSMHASHCWLSFTASSAQQRLQFGRRAGPKRS